MSREFEKNAQFTLRLPADLKERVKQTAKAQDIDSMTWIRHAIREKLEREAGNNYTETDQEKRLHEIEMQLMQLQFQMNNMKQSTTKNITQNAGRDANIKMK